MIFTVWHIFILLEQKMNVNLIKTFVKLKGFYGIVMLSEKNNILGFNQYIKSDKMPYIIYADIESLIKKKKKKRDGCANNPENSSATKVGEHIPCGYSMWTIWAFDHIGNKQNLYRRKDCMKKFCESLSESLKKHKKMCNWFWKEKVLPLTKEERKSHQDAKLCYICGKRILKELSTSMHHQKKLEITVII